MRLAEPDRYTGVTMEDGRFYVLFEHPTARSIVKKRLQLHPDDVAALRKVLDAYALLTDRAGVSCQEDTT